MLPKFKFKDLIVPLGSSSTLVNRGFQMNIRFGFKSFIDFTLLSLSKIITSIVCLRKNEWIPKRVLKNTPQFLNLIMPNNFSNSFNLRIGIFEALLVEIFTSIRLLYKTSSFLIKKV